MKIRQRFAIALALGLFTVAQPQQSVAQQDTTLASQVQRLDQQLRVLQRLRELERDSIVAASKTKAGLTASKDGFTIKSADGDFQLKLRGYLQADGRFFLSDSVVQGTNTFFLRRARSILEATVFKYIDFRLMPDFGQGTTVLFDAYGDIRFRPAFVLRAGKAKPPVGFERLQSATDIRFNERGLPTNLVPNRDVGLQAYGDLGGGRVAYAAGVFNGVPDLGNGDGDVSDAKDFAARIFLQPFLKQTGSLLSGLGFGVSGSTGIERGSTTAQQLPGYRTPGQATFFKYSATAFANGHRRRVSPQLYFATGPLGLLGEYVISTQEVTKGATTANLKHRAWQAQGSFFLTGEKNSYKTVTPKKVFDPTKGAWGAIEIAARYGELKLDDATFPTYATATTAASKARAWGVGLNWYLAKYIKMAVDYELTKFTGGATTGDRETEQFVDTRFQFGL